MRTLFLPSRRRRNCRTFQPELIGLETRRLLSGDDFMVIPGGLSQDMAVIAQSSVSLGEDTSMLYWGSLLRDGGAPWAELRPYAPTTVASNPQDYTYEVGGSTVHVISDTYSDVTSTSGEDGSWDMVYNSYSIATFHTTGPYGLDGSTFIDHSTQTHQFTYHEWSSGDGTTHYMVLDNSSYSGYYEINGGSGSSRKLKTEEAREINLMAQGEMALDYSYTGSFTYSGFLSRGFSLQNKSGSNSVGDPLSNTDGFSVDYNASSKLTFDTSGSLIPDGSNQGTFELESSLKGEVVAWDADGDLAGGARDDGDKVTSEYSGAQAPTGSSATTGPVSVTSPSTALDIPKGKNVVTVIDKGDRGWLDWTPAQRQYWLSKHPGSTLDPNKPNPTIASGPNFVSGLTPATTVVYGYGIQQVISDIRTATAKTGLADVLVFGDHGGANGQQIGVDYLQPVSSAEMNDLVGLIASGGTLIMTGCNVFGSQSAINAWQQYATAHNITIMGSASLVYWNPGTKPTGVWITLKPGGTAPTLTP